MEALEIKSETTSDKSTPSIRWLLEDLFLRLDDAGVLYCVLRNYEELPERIGNDIDLLVHPGHVKIFRERLERVIADSGWSLLKNFERFRFHSYWLKAGQGHLVLHIDVWSVHHWKGICYAGNAAFFEKRKRFRQFYIPDPAVEVGLLFIKDLIQNDKVKTKYRKRIQEFAKAHPEGIQEFLQWPLGARLAGRMTEKASHGAWDDIDAKSWTVRRAVLWRAFLRNPVSPFIDFSGFLWGHFWSRLTRPNGIFLVLIGPDGSGKSTVAKQLQKSLRDLFDIHQYYHGHFGLLPELKIFRNFFLGAIGRKPPAPPAEAHNVPAHGLLRVLIYVFYYSVDYFLGHWIVRGFQSKGHLIIFDRYFYDWFIQGYYGRTPRWLLPILKAVLPRPDLVVHLRNSPEIVHHRKAELTVEQIEDQAEKCREIVQGLTHAITVSTDSSVDEVVQAIAERVMEIMAKRFQINRQ